MFDPADFPITRKWPARHPERLQLYSLPTPNGVKVSIMLEETGLPYGAHRVDFAQQEQLSEAFRSLNPNRNFSLGPQSDRLLCRGRTRRLRRLSAREPRARALSGAPGRSARTGDSERPLTPRCGVRGRDAQCCSAFVMNASMLCCSCGSTAGFR